MQQYIRKCSLVVAGRSGDALDLSSLRIVFQTHKADSMTPNTADIRIYNLAEATMRQIQKEYTSVILQGGYEQNFGVIFSGNIKQVRTGRENGTETFLDIYAGDGDQAYNYSVVNTTLAAGATQADQINAAAAPMQERDVQPGYIGPTGDAQLARGKVMYGMSRDYLRQSAEASESTWSIQDGRLQVVPRTGLLPGQAVVLNSKSGLIGTPEQTNDGITVRCLLNPLLRVGGRVQIDQRDIAQAKIQNTAPDGVSNSPPAITADGFYRLLTVEHKGDTRGNDWYSDLVCLDVNATLPAEKAVKPK